MASLGPPPAASPDRLGLAMASLGPAPTISSALLVGAALALVAACGSGSGGSSGNGAGPRRPPGPEHAADEHARPRAAAVAPAPTERECDDLIAHAVALRVAELRQTLPAEQVPTEA